MTQTPCDGGKSRSWVIGETAILAPEILHMSTNVACLLASLDVGEKGILTIAYKASRMCFLNGERAVCGGEGSCSGGVALFDSSPVRVVLSAS